MTLITNICIIHIAIVQHFHISPKEGKVYFHFQFFIAFFLTCVSQTNLSTVVDKKDTGFWSNAANTAISGQFSTPLKTTALVAPTSTFVAVFFYWISH